MLTKKLYLSGASPYELQHVFTHIRGVERAVVGLIEAKNASGEWQTVCGIEVTYSPKKLDVSMLLDILFAVVNPYAKEWDERYRSGVYYEREEDRLQVEFCLNFIRNRGKPPSVGESHITVNDPNTVPKFARRCYAQTGKLQRFCAAEEEHQNYIKKHPNTETRIDFAKLKAYLDIWVERQ